MSLATTIQEEVQQFLDSYSRSFEQYDSALVADHFTYPLHLTSDAGKIVVISVPSRESWQNMLDGLLATYKKLGVRSAILVNQALVALSPALVQAQIKWRLHNAEG